MKTELIQSLTENFEAHAQRTGTGVEFWLARDLQYLLGYTEWRNFTAVISKARTACEVSGHNPGDHFVDVNKTIAMPKGAEKEVPDIMLTRYACYLVAQNGDPKKQEIAFAQTYFAIQTRKAELIEQRLLEAERVMARKKLSMTEKELSDVIYEQTGGNENFALIRSKGDHALFGKTTQARKLIGKCRPVVLWRILHRPLSSKPRTSRPKSPFLTPASTRWIPRTRFPASTLPITRLYARPCWNAAYIRKNCRQPRTLERSSGA